MPRAGLLARKKKKKQRHRLVWFLTLTVDDRFPSLNITTEQVRWRNALKRLRDNYRSIILLGFVRHVTALHWNPKTSRKYILKKTNKKKTKVVKNAARSCRLWNFYLNRHETRRSAGISVNPPPPPPFFFQVIYLFPVVSKSVLLRCNNRSGSVCVLWVHEWGFPHILNCKLSITRVVNTVFVRISANVNVWENLWFCLFVSQGFVPNGLTII